MKEIISAVVAAVQVMKSVLPSIFIGLFLANLVSLRNISDNVKRRGGIIASIVRITGLPKEIATAVLLSFGDRTAGMAVLAVAQKDFGLADRQVIAANLASKAPSVVQFFLFSFIPVTLALFPKNIALRFLVLYFLAFLVISALGIIACRLYPVKHLSAQAPQRFGINADISWYRAAKLSLRRTLRPFLRMSATMFLMSIVAMLFIKSGVLLKLLDFFTIAGKAINGNILAIVGPGLISMMGGVAVVGAGYHEGVVQSTSIVGLLFLISILHNCYDLFASSIPRSIAIYGRKLGLKVCLSGFVVTQIVMLTAYLLIRRNII